MSRSKASRAGSSASARSRRCSARISISAAAARSVAVVRAVVSSRARLRSTPRTPESAAACAVDSSAMTRARVSAAARERARAPGMASVANRSKWLVTRFHRACATVSSAAPAGAAPSSRTSTRTAPRRVASLFTATTSRARPPIVATPCQGFPGTPARSSGVSSAPVSSSVPPRDLKGEWAQWVESSAASACGISGARAAETLGRIPPSGCRRISYAEVRVSASMRFSVRGRGLAPAGLSDRWDWPFGGRGEEGAGRRLEHVEERQIRERNPEQDPERDT